MKNQGRSSGYMKRKNVIVVFPDQLGAKWIGCYGNNEVFTPNIDRFSMEVNNVRLRLQCFSTLYAGERIFIYRPLSVPDGY